MTVDYVKLLEQEKANSRAQGRGKALAYLSLTETPYKWQTEAFKAWEDNGYRGTIVAATGTGKTNLAFMGLQKLAEPSMIVVPTEPILWRWYEDLTRRGVQCGLFYGGAKTVGKDVDIAIINSVERNPLVLNNYSFITIDEIHHLGGIENSQLLMPLKGKKVLGLTATLERQDSAHLMIELGITNIEQAYRASRMPFPPAPTELAIPTLYKYSVGQAMRDGVISHLEIITIGVKLYCGCGNVSSEGMYNTRGKIVTKEYGHSRTCEKRLHDEYTAEIGKLWAQLRPRDMTQLLKMGSQGAYCVSLISKRKALLSNAAWKPDAARQIIERHKGQKVLLFAESIPSVDKVKAYITAHGIACQTYHSKMDDKVRKGMFDEWRAGKFDVLLSVRSLDEGVDVPECKVAIVIASGHAQRQWIQRVGRILRKTGAGAKLYIIYCTDSMEKNFPAEVDKILSE